MKFKRLFLVVIAFLSITLLANAQCKIKISVDNQTHEKYMMSGKLTDGSNTINYSFTAYSGQISVYNTTVPNSNWYRKNFRAWHWTYNLPAADLIGNAAGPVLVYSDQNPSSPYNRVRQDPMQSSGNDKMYYYNIKAN